MCCFPVVVVVVVVLLLLFVFFFCSIFLKICLLSQAYLFQMFFFLGGLTQKRVLFPRLPKELLSKNSNADRLLFRCIPCQRMTKPIAIRFDQWISIFFIPLVRVQTGTPLLACSLCQTPYLNHPDFTDKWRDSTDKIGNVCIECGYDGIEKSFKYCPECGTHINNE